MYVYFYSDTSKLGTLSFLKDVYIILSDITKNQKNISKTIAATKYMAITMPSNGTSERICDNRATITDKDPQDNHCNRGSNKPLPLSRYMQRGWFRLSKAWTTDRGRKCLRRKKRGLLHRKIFCRYKGIRDDLNEKQDEKEATLKRKEEREEKVDMVSGGKYVQP